jgi:hypothetical protein
VLDAIAQKLNGQDVDSISTWKKLLVR